MTRLGPYTVHPVADKFPLLDGAELKALADDILANGLYEPIVTNHDATVLIDGRNRYRACELAGMDPSEYRLPVDYTEEMIRDFIVGANIKRRHLNPSQLGLMAVKLKPFYAEAAEKRKGGRPRADAEKPRADRPEVSGRARDQAAAAVGASGRLVARAEAIQSQLDLVDAVWAGQMSLDAAEKELKKRDAGKPRPEPAPKPAKTMLTLLTHEGVEVAYPQPASKATFNESKGPGISWAAWSWNPVTGCLHGCPYCYAREITHDERFKNAYPVQFTPLFHHERLTAPANTTIPVKHRDDPAYRRVFVCSMADLYGRWVPQDWIEQVHAVMLESPEWQYITLTKFPDRYPGLELPPGAWIGTSVDEQKRVRIAERAFAQLPSGIVKWLSLEPLLAPLEFTDLSLFDWVVIGAQTETRQPTGVVPAFRPPFEWVARIVMQAREAGCRIHMKSNLRYAPGMELLDEYPE